MAFATLMEFDVDLDTHIKIGESVGDAPVKGLILHGGGPSERGVYSLDVWESKEDSERFLPSGWCRRYSSWASRAVRR